LREPAPGSRPVEIAPAGVWHVREAPRRIVAYETTEAEIAIALGLGEGLLAMFDREHLATLQRLYYSQLPGVSVDLAGVEELPFGEHVDPELFYRIEADVFLIDPRLPITSWNWQPEQLAQLTQRVAPFVGNFIRWRDASWGPAYPRYSLEEYTERIAALLDREERYRRLAEFRAATLQQIRKRLPPPEQRPSLCVLNLGSDPAAGRFYLVDIGDGALRTRQYRDLGCRQAWDAEELTTGEFGACDYETLAAIDPDVIIVQWALAKSEGPEDFQERFVAPMREHAIGRRLQAVRSERVLPGGSGAQGPITHLFHVELAAQQLHPDRFGAWTWGAVPAEPLIDRAELAGIVRDATP